MSTSRGNLSISPMVLVYMGSDAPKCCTKCELLRGSGSHKVQEDLPVISHKSEIVSITRGDYMENSSDLSSGRRPTSKSDEFSM